MLKPTVNTKRKNPSEGEQQEGDILKTHFISKQGKAIPITWKSSKPPRTVEQKRQNKRAREAREAEEDEIGVGTDGEEERTMERNRTLVTLQFMCPHIYYGPLPPYHLPAGCGPKAAACWRGRRESMG